MAAATRIQFRRGTADEWRRTNPVLAAGEPGFETDTGVHKIGDGVTRFSSLPAYVRADALQGQIQQAVQASGGITSKEVRQIVVLSQAAYDVLQPSDDVLYVIAG